MRRHATEEGLITLQLQPGPLPAICVKAAGRVGLVDTDSVGMAQGLRARIRDHDREAGAGAEHHGSVA